jgi:hyperosmotically inducible protein
MNKFLKIKAVTLLVCGGLVSGGVLAAKMPGTSTKKASQQVVDPAQQAQDEQLTKDVKSVLSKDAYKVDVTSQLGVVALSGQLDSEADYDKVVVLTQSTKGVNDVNVEKLTVKDSVIPLYDIYITAKAKGAFIQAGLMAQDVSSWPIKLQTKDAQVYLSGQVVTEQQKQNLLDVVKNIKGVTKVHDQMTMSSSDATSQNGDSDSDEDDDVSDDSDEGSGSSTY